jgi:hypothetical protein
MTRQIALICTTKLTDVATSAAAQIGGSGAATGASAGNGT